VTPKQKNLLEAFRDAGGSGSEERTSSAGPFAGPPAGSKKKSSPPSPSPARTPGEKTPLPSWVPLVLVGALCFVLGLMVGRQSGTGEEEVQAGGSGGGATEVANPSTARHDESARYQPSTPPTNPRTNPSSTGTQPTTAPDPTIAALQDPANQHTIVAVTYGGSQDDSARATMRYFRDLGLPASPPVKSGSYLLVLVGASPTKAGLADLLRRVQGAEDQHGAKPFKDAYLTEIDKLVQR